MRYSSSITRRKRRGRTEYIAVLNYYDQSGQRRQKRRTSFSSSEAKRIARALANEYLEGGEVALYSDNLTFDQLADHCQQTKYCEAEYDQSGNKLFGVRDTSVYEAHLKHFKEFFGKVRVRDIRVGMLRAYRNHRLRSKTKGCPYRKSNPAFESLHLELKRKVRCSRSIHSISGCLQRTMSVCSVLYQLLRTLLKPRLSLVAENLALRQQLVILRRNTTRPRLRNRDRLFWVILSHLWRDWRSILIIVKPETVIKWHRQGFKCYWRWKSRTGGVGRPRIDQEIRDLIRRMSHENPTWGVPRIQAELHLLGYKVAESTVAKYRIRFSNPPSQTWKSFLRNHANEIVAIDFFIVPTVTFNILYGFVVLLHNRRQVVHFIATAHPTAGWTAQQITEAFPEETAPRFLLRDRDSIYGEEFRGRVARMGIEEVITTARSPWQNAYAERLIGSIRRECLDHLIVFNERQLRRILREYFAYYNEVRPHQSLEMNAPVAREVEPPAKGKIISLPQVGGLHHCYLRAA